MPSTAKLKWFKKSSFLLRHLSIKHRLLIAFLITSLLPVVIVAFYSNQIYETSTTTKISETSTQTLDELARNISRELEQYETLSENIIINPSIQTGLARYSQLTDLDKNVLQTLIRKQLDQQIFSFSNLSNVVIMTNTGAAFFDLGYQWYPGDQLSQVITQTDDVPRNAYWSYLRSNRGTPTLALTRKIYSENDLNVPLGYVVLCFDEKGFARNLYQSVNLGKGSSIYITDDNGLVISSLNSAIVQGTIFRKDMISKMISSQHQEKSEAFESTILNTKMLVTHSAIQMANWHIIGLIPHSFIVSELNGLRNHIIVLCLLTLMLSAILSMWIYFSISSPMRSLLLFAKRVDRGKLDGMPQQGPYPDEMQQLTSTIYIMVDRLKHLIVQIQTEQQAKREAELKMLQAQINPHFLFNTLNSLKWSAMLSGNASLTQGIGSLSELLHNTILVKEEMIPLAKEVENVQHYANIQRIRYGDSFSLEVQLPEDTATWIVPKFILQPIVENSILHAGSDEHDKVNIRVEAYLCDQGIQIIISDNGKGFDQTTNIQQTTLHSPLSGIGITNVHERIRLHYGEPYGLITHSQINYGTTTEIILPKLDRTKEDKSDV